MTFCVASNQNENSRPVKRLWNIFADLDGSSCVYDELEWSGGAETLAIASTIVCKNWIEYEVDRNTLTVSK